MSEFLVTLSTEQKKNVLGLISCMKKNGITNSMMQAGILAVLSKESTFIPKTEKDYSKTDNSRIRSIFGVRLKEYDDSQLTVLKKSPKDFFDQIYGGRYENGLDEGYKYRGRGFNQLTFKSNYKKTANLINIDIVQYPDKLNEVPVATEAVISFFKEKFSGAPKAKLILYGMTDINSANTLDDAVNSAYHANTGWGKTKEQIVNEKTGGYAKAINRVAEFYDLTSGKVKLSVSPKPTTFSETAPSPIGTATNVIIKSVCVNTETLNIRIKPDVKSAKIKDHEAAKFGEKFSVFEQINGWYKIAETKNQWISGKYCKDIE